MNGAVVKSVNPYCRKTPRYNKAQKEALLKYMENHSLFASGKFIGDDGRDRNKAMWDELTRILNSLGPAQKDSTQWNTVWRDLKFKVNKKLGEVRRICEATGGKKPGVQLPTIDALDLRVAEVIGLHYMLGESGKPESDECLELLGTGGKYILQPQLFLDKEETSEQASVQEIFKKNASATRPSSTYVINQNTNKKFKKARRVRIAKQLYEVRRNFQEIASSQAKSMELLAQSIHFLSEAATSQAKSAAEMAQAALLQAENERKKIVILERLSDAVEHFLKQ